MRLERGVGKMNQKNNNVFAVKLREKVWKGCKLNAYHFEAIGNSEVFEDGKFLIVIKRNHSDEELFYYLIDGTKSHLIDEITEDILYCYKKGVLIGEIIEIY
jgi:hypothetical protein